MSEESILLPILKNLQDGQSDLKNGQLVFKNSLDRLRVDLNMQLTAINEKLSGQWLSELEVRRELSELRERLQTVERRLELR